MCHQFSTSSSWSSSPLRCSRKLWQIPISIIQSICYLLTQEEGRCCQVNPTIEWREEEEAPHLVCNRRISDGCYCTLKFERQETAKWLSDPLHFFISKQRGREREKLRIFQISRVTMPRTTSPNPDWHWLLAGRYDWLAGQLEVEFNWMAVGLSWGFMIPQHRLDLASEETCSLAVQFSSPKKMIFRNERTVTSAVEWWGVV